MPTVLVWRQHPVACLATDDFPAPVFTHASVHRGYTGYAQNAYIWVNLHSIGKAQSSNARVVVFRKLRVISFISALSILHSAQSWVPKWSRKKSLVSPCLFRVSPVVTDLDFQSFGTLWWRFCLCQDLRTVPGTLFSFTEFHFHVCTCCSFFSCIIFVLSTFALGYFFVFVFFI